MVHAMLRVIIINSAFKILPNIQFITKMHQDTSPVEFHTVVSAQITRIIQRLSICKMEFTQIQNDMRELSRVAERMERQMNKMEACATKSSARRNTHPVKVGFARPGHISTKMAEFMNVQAGTLMARTDVTRRLSTYTKENELVKRDSETGKCRIFPDSVIESLLQFPSNVDPASISLTHFSIQRYLNHHFLSQPEEVGASKKQNLTTLNK